MSGDYHANACKMQQERVEQAMLLYAIFRVYLSSSDADCLYTNSDRLSQLIGTQASQQTIGKLVSITRMGKQRSPISIVHRSPLNALGDRDNAITSYSTVLHSRHSALLALCACDGIMFHVVSFCNLSGS